MSEYTPTTERVRLRWLEAYEYERDMPGKIRERYADEVLAQYDRWLAEHDRQVAERAWDEGYGSDEECHTPRRNPYRKEQENTNA